ncbi:MAG: transglycosylase domain-containing protein [Clostridiales bacterium]|nr:transglycosylase domain-containing protein [Clostridiales bacterium]MDD7036093.1 transglycosylase domain-containing protein [Bacillota bacterium]MDY2920821.1 transglycosylase domain-containing protein [Lentihominibacter sp.]
MSDRNKKNNSFNDDDFFAKFDNVEDSSESSDDFYYGSSKNYRNSSGTAGRSASSGRRSAGKKKAASAASSSGNDRKARRREAAEKFAGSGRVKKTARESGVKKTFKFIFLLGMAMVVAVGIFVGLVFIKAPAIDTDNIYSQISQRSVMYDSEGKEIESLYSEDGNRTVVKYKDIPEDMVNAIVSLEDKKFWTHNGFNFVRMVGAVKDSIFGGGRVSGTSTVTQQLARNVYLSEIKSERSLTRKITEMYCTIVLEKNMSKEQIMEAYLNTIYLGFNSYGVEAAAQSYFDKSITDCDLLECASLAALPQLPDTYALVYADYNNLRSELPIIKKSGSVTYRYNNASEDRRNLVLSNMADKGYITTAQMEEAQNANLKSHIKIGEASDASASSYFTDYAIEQLTDDLIAEYGVSEAEAKTMLYTSGLKIYTTMDSDIQNIMEDEFSKSTNYSSVAYTRTNADGDMVSEEGKLLAYNYSNMISDKKFTFKKGEYKMNSDGSMTIYKGNRLNLYQTEVNDKPDVSIEFKGMYLKEDGIFYFIEGGVISVPQGYKTLDSSGNCIISADFFSNPDYKDMFSKDGDTYSVSENYYTLKQKVRQPQAAAVIMENDTGEIKAMMGGRGVTGKQLYNRAVNPRQPGSSIKPLAIYGPALQMSYEYEEEGKSMNLDTSEGSDWGKYITAGSIINDAATKDGNGKVWPKNVYNGYKGDMSLRTAVQQSVNVCAYKTYLQIERNEGAEYSINMLKKVGITSIDDEADANPAALALGGLTRGISPLEETAAFATFPNGGVYKTPVFYTRVEDSKGNVKLQKETEETKVYDEGVAWIMTDVLRTVVTNGGATNANIGYQPVGGKTGTTSDKYDIWFSGFTPQYTMALWMGNDINMDLGDSSPKACTFWANIMRRVCENIPRASFFEKPDNVTSVKGEYYIEGTYAKVKKEKDDKDKDKKETTETTTVETTLPPTTMPITTAPAETTPPETTPSSPVTPSGEGGVVTNP